MPKKPAKPPRAAAPAADRFRSTRRAHHDETAEDYVEAIDSIIERSGEARVRDLARMMGVSHVTVSRIVTRLQAHKLVDTRPRAPITLTAAGKALARRARQRHEVVLNFLRAIGVPERDAQIDSEGIEHHVSEATFRAMKRLADKHTK